MAQPDYAPAMRPLPLLAVLILGCAETSASGPKPEIIEDCPAAVAAEKELAAKEGRKPIPIIQKGRLLTNIASASSRPDVTFDMIAAAQGAPLKAVARLHVGTHGQVEQVDILKSSGVRSFDAALVEKMKTWQHLPFVMTAIRCPTS